jgi:hypothetical protein
MLVWRKNFEDGHCPRPGLCAAPPPYLELPELSLIPYVKVKPMENILPLSLGLGQGKLMLRCENRKIRRDNEIQKANERFHKV